MAVLNRNKEPATADDRTVVQDQASAETAAPAGRAASTRTAAPGVGLRAASAGAGAVAMVARVIRIVVGLAVLVIALGILFVALNAATGNTIVSHVHSWASWLTTPFHNMFHVRGARGTLALNWGVAIIVYLAVAWLITRILLTPWRAVRRRTAAV